MGTVVYGGGEAGIRPHEHGPNLYRSDDFNAEKTYLPLSYCAWVRLRCSRRASETTKAAATERGRAGSGPDSSRCGAGRIGERQWIGRRFGNGRRGFPGRWQGSQGAGRRGPAREQRTVAGGNRTDRLPQRVQRRGGTEGSGASGRAEGRRRCPETGTGTGPHRIRTRGRRIQAHEVPGGTKEPASERLSEDRGGVQRREGALRHGAGRARGRKIAPRPLHRHTPRTPRRARKASGSTTRGSSRRFPAASACEKSTRDRR